ncbi:hypothetical protein [Jiella endophytica]|uniref:hypothetical protein n=1 Tax=Jiella endophytica TaxID=2558362 RepID=UPI0014306A91|nr:hypothetical protein [Jiella endophytica]
MENPRSEETWGEAFHEVLVYMRHNGLEALIVGFGVVGLMYATELLLKSLN